MGPVRAAWGRGKVAWGGVGLSRAAWGRGKVAWGGVGLSIGLSIMELTPKLV